ncbi:DUF1887 family CARF protein [Nitrosomonas communis]|uniref:Card1-like endonuclease domain-containing protein n=1 Tax=Nitrosomonas communis TaxID=44574 RepID=UPI0026F35A80|nr:DUF1887 family CARF protein [Nitrosomonas communis]MCO6427470.1 DUF1887 family protein [Nitrosomonas communis]
MKFDSHLCLVSAQATPNLVPALDPAFQPASVTLAVSADMQEKARWLEKVLKERGIQVEKLALADAYDYNQCWECFAEWLGRQSSNVALNVTGGTKVMAMAAQDVFREEKKPVFYVNIETDEVIRLDTREAPFTLPTRIRLKQYLEAHGYIVPKKLNKPDINRDIRDFINRLAYESERLGKALGTLNWLASQAVATRETGAFVSPALNKHDLDSKALDELITMFKNENKLSLQNDKLVFPDEDARKFVNGGWLEYLVFQTLATLAGELGGMDWATGIEILAPDGRRTQNELDAACLLKNTLHIIECKSANLSSNGKTGESSGTDALYKLDALRRIGGLRTKAMLVDFRGSLRDIDKSLAAQMNLAVVSGSQLRNLQGEIKTWLK